VKVFSGAAPVGSSIETVMETGRNRGEDDDEHVEEDVIAGPGIERVREVS